MDKTFLAFLVDWEDNGRVIALAGPSIEEEAIEAVKESLKHHGQDVSGYVMPVQYVGHGQA